MRVALGILLAIVLGIVVLILWPSPIDSRPFASGPMPELTGPLAPNRLLEACRRISVGDVAHADKLLLDGQGRVYAGEEGGRILRLLPDGRGAYSEVYAEPGGRPMELAFDPEGNLIVADLEGSHLRIDGERETPTGFRPWKGCLSEPREWPWPGTASSTTAPTPSGIRTPKSWKPS